MLLDEFPWTPYQATVDSRDGDRWYLRVGNGFISSKLLNHGWRREEQSFNADSISGQNHGLDMEEDVAVGCQTDQLYFKIVSVLDGSRTKGIS